MQNFEFYNPTRIVFGTATIARLADLVPADARVLVLFGGNSARNNGTLAEVMTALSTVADFNRCKGRRLLRIRPGVTRMSAVGHEETLLLWLPSAAEARRPEIE